MRKRLARWYPVLLTSTTPLTDAYDLAMLDLDGVVYIGGRGGAGCGRRRSAQARGAGMRVAFITNNASRPPAGRCRSPASSWASPAAVDDVVTSGPGRRPGWRGRPGAPVRGSCAWVLPASRRRWSRRVWCPVGATDDAAGRRHRLRARAVAWRAIMRTAVRVRDGLPWIASNTDHDDPDGLRDRARARCPGRDDERGSRGVTPVVAGKPARPLLDETVRRVGGEPAADGRRPARHRHRGCPQRRARLAARPDRGDRPAGARRRAARRCGRRTSRATSRDSGRRARAPERQGDDWLLGGLARRGWPAGVLEVAAGPGDPDPDDAWRVAAAAAWAHLDATGTVADITAAGLPAPGGAAR